MLGPILRVTGCNLMSKPGSRFRTLLNCGGVAQFLSWRAGLDGPISGGSAVAQDGARLTYPVVDTGQDRCYDNAREIAFPSPGADYFGQDAQYVGHSPLFTDHADGTVTGRITGLMWQKTPAARKYDQRDSEAYADKLRLAGHADWRLPTIKELFSLTDFRGNQHAGKPYLDTSVFDFEFPVATGNRPGTRGMDGQYALAIYYLGITTGRDRSSFGFNFAAGRIKSYPLRALRYVRRVRGNPRYGRNSFRDNRDGTVSDLATGLVWQQADSGRAMDWRESLRYADKFKLAGQGDWRLPNVKELQSIVDHGRAPSAQEACQRGAAIDPVFRVSETGSWFWSGRTHLGNGFGCYVCFGRAFSARKWRDERMDAQRGRSRAQRSEGRCQSLAAGTRSAGRRDSDQKLRALRAGRIGEAGSAVPGRAFGGLAVCSSSGSERRRQGVAR